MAIDRIRRENKRDGKQKEAQLLYDDEPAEPVGVIDDERLRLIPVQLCLAPLDP
jgi:RNA polymerase sigma-70 factor, ECF subfamily